MIENDSVAKRVAVGALAVLPMTVGCFVVSEFGHRYGPMVAGYFLMAAAMYGAHSGSGFRVTRWQFVSAVWWPVSFALIVAEGAFKLLRYVFRWVRTGKA